MRSKKHNRTAAHKRWHDAVASLGLVISGAPAVLHHAAGATAKHNKIEIGEWWVIPLTDEEHKALHNGETFGHESRKEFEKAAFRKVAIQLAVNGEAVEDVPDEVFDEIQDYRR